MSKKRTDLLGRVDALVDARFDVRVDVVSVKNDLERGNFEVGAETSRRRGPATSAGGGCRSGVDVGRGRRGTDSGRRRRRRCTCKGKNANLSYFLLHCVGTFRYRIYYNLSKHGDNGTCLRDVGVETCRH